MSSGTSIAVGGRQVAQLFRHLTMSSCQADDHGVTWWFDGGLWVRMEDGAESLTLGVVPDRGTICAGEFAGAAACTCPNPEDHDASH